MEEKKYKYWCDKDEKEYDIIIRFGNEELEDCIRNILQDTELRISMDNKNLSDLK